MFGKMMYYDRKTVAEYKAIIEGKPQVQIEEYEVSGDKGIGVGLKMVSAEAKATKSYVAKPVDNSLYECREFEKALAKCDDYFDFTATDKFDFRTVPQGSIVKMNASLEIPENFDVLQLVNMDIFKPFLMDKIDASDIEEDGKAVIEGIMKGSNVDKIPIVADVDDNLLCFKLRQENLICEYGELEEIDGEEVTVLARISSGMVKSDKPFYDPLKDFMKMNRMMRRAMKDQDGELSPLRVESDYRKADVLAIYM